jgi:nucleoside-triphosphatase THEP1
MLTEATYIGVIEAAAKIATTNRKLLEAGIPSIAQAYSRADRDCDPGGNAGGDRHQRRGGADSAPRAEKRRRSMSGRRHILICGEVGAGKSTLIQKLLKETNRPLYGFMTKRLEADETGFHPIYIHPAGAGERTHGAENQIGTCDSKVHNINVETFDTLGVDYLGAEPDGLIVMDELGFMEAGAARFVRKVFEALDGDIPVIAAVKARYDVSFLNDVRAHPNARLFNITKENRDALYRELLPLVLGWNL